MDFDEYRRRGKEMVDYIADYLENIRDRRVYPNVKPGYMRNLLPESAPIEGENWDSIFNDVERVIMPGITHWQSPHMHAYFPALNSFPSLLGDMLADAINCLGFTWASSPACTELETIVMNWLGKMIGLPDEFLHMNSTSKGGGVIQTTASESTLVCLLAGRTLAIKRFHEKSPAPGFQDAEINARLVAYCSDQAHSSVEKAALIGLVRMRYIEADENLALRGKPLQEAIEDDIKKGLIPFWVCVTLGTTGACSFDNLEEVGNVCRDHNLWLHVDAAYAGSAFICPEHRIWLKGIEKVDSIAFNPSKWLMVNFDCTALWVKDSTAVHRTFNVEPLYLQHENSGLAIDYMHWQIPLSKRFRALKLWFVLRSFGIKGLQKHIREGVRLAQKFEALVSADHRFEIPAPRHLGMVVFRIKGDNELTERLLKRLNHRGKLHCVPASLKGKYVIRFTVTSTRTTTDDILADWQEIRQVTTDILEELNVRIVNERAKVSLKETREKNEAFGSSLLLANSPMSPKIVNGSFAAIFDADEFLAKTYAGIRIAINHITNGLNKIVDLVFVSNANAFSVARCQCPLISSENIRPALEIFLFLNSCKIDVKRSFNLYNFNSKKTCFDLLRKFSLIDWNITFISNDLNVACFHRILSYCFSNSISARSKKNVVRCPDWCDDRLKRLCYSCNKIWLIHQKTKMNEDYIKFLCLYNIFLLKLVENIKNEPTKFLQFKHLKKRNSGLSLNKIINSSLPEICSWLGPCFKSLFSSVIDRKFLKISSKCIFHMEIEKLLQKANSKYRGNGGSDSVILKDCNKNFAQCFLGLFNQILSNGYIPGFWKWCHTNEIKKFPKSYFKNFNTLAKLPFISKHSSAADCKFLYFTGQPMAESNQNCFVNGKLNTKPTLPELNLQNFNTFSILLVTLNDGVINSLGVPQESDAGPLLLVICVDDSIEIVPLELLICSDDNEKLIDSHILFEDKFHLENTISNNYHSPHSNTPEEEGENFYEVFAKILQNYARKEPLFDSMAYKRCETSSKDGHSLQVKKIKVH